MKEQDKLAKILDVLNDCPQNSQSLKEYHIYDTEFFWGGGSMGHQDPVVKVGDNSIIVKMRNDNYDEYAFKCYINNLSGREERYNLILKNIRSARSEYFVEPDYYPEELNGIDELQALPVLKYKWIEGEDLYTYIETYAHDIFELKLLTYNFSRFINWLASQPFAHGSLSCDNIIVNANGDIKIVDYDNMYTPEMMGLKAKTIGDKNYINPELTLADFGKSIDTTPSLVILLSLLIISTYPSLYKKDSRDRHCLFLLEELVNLPVILPNGLLAEQNKTFRFIYGLLMSSLGDKTMLIDSEIIDSINNPITENSNRITIKFGKGHFNMVYIEPGEYYKGATSNLQHAFLAEQEDIPDGQSFTYDKEAEIDEQPITHEYSGGFWICETLIKNSVWDIRSYGENGYYQALDWNTLNWPIMSVTYEEAIQFAKLLSKSFGLNFDIPTETEWEFAAKGGNLTNHYKYSGSNNPQEVAVYNLPPNYSFDGCPLKTKKPNELDIYDMSGLLFEWCKDEYSPNELKSFSPPRYYRLKDGLKIHIRRGGCMKSAAHECRNTSRRRENYFELYHEDGCYHMDSLEYIDTSSNSYIDDSNFYRYTGLRVILRNFRPFDIQGLIEPFDVNNSCKEFKEDENHSKISEDGKLFISCDDNCRNLVVNHGINVLGQGCCQSKHNLFSVELPSSLKIISDQSFWGCENLETVLIRYGVFSIGTQAFWACSKLKSIELPDSLKYMEYGAFSGCKSLKFVHIPNSVEQLADNNFSFCSSLEEIVIPNTIKKIPSNFLWSCTSLKSVTLPESIIEIEGNPFRESGIEKIDCKTEHFHFENGFLMTADKKTLIACLSKQETIVLPSTIETIEKEAFEGIKNVSSVILPYGLKYIRRSAFSGCCSIKSIDIPETIRYIDSDIFYGCDNLKLLTIRCPYSSIGSSSFSGISLTEVYVTQDFDKYQKLFNEQLVKFLSNTMNNESDDLPF